MKRIDLVEARDRLLDQELRLMGIRDDRVLEAMRQVPRERFLPEHLREFAYHNVALPIEEGQTISQPYIVALMAEALELDPDDRVLEVGAGSGYAAAVLSRLAREVYTIERHEALARLAAERMQELGFDNVHVRQGDGSVGWPEHAPYDAIVVAAAGPGVPKALLEQLAIGGRLVIPVGETQETQKLVRVIRQGDEDYRYEELGGVRFVPLIGEQAWKSDEVENRLASASVSREQKKRTASLPELIRQAAEPVGAPEDPEVEGLLKRIGDARVVLIGEASHGTSEFYRVRAAITQALIEQKGFDMVAIEGDWPDAWRINDFVTHRDRSEPYDWEAFARFPTWMWRNQETLDFIHWLREFNLDRPDTVPKIGFYGLDIYSLFTSIDRVLEFLDQHDPEVAAIARQRYGCLTPWQHDPAAYGHAAVTGRYQSCEDEVVRMLTDLSEQRLKRLAAEADDVFDAEMNARLIRSAERYYRVMYYGHTESWNLRDQHMFDTLSTLLKRRGPDSKVVVWEHNSHLGDASATQFGKHGQWNVGQLCRQAFGSNVYAIGQGTDRGTVAAATEWGGPMEIKQVRPAHPDSYEHLMHLSEMQSFFLPLRDCPIPQLKTALAERRLERAIGVIYRPETELQSHYFFANLARQFDEWIWFDETSAVRALKTQAVSELEPVHPFATIDE